jgi:hypothetical protein
LIFTSFPSLEILLECLPEAPFKEQLKLAIQQEIDFQSDSKVSQIMKLISERQDKSKLAASILEDNCKIQQGILMKLREIMKCKEGESITKVAEEVMKYPNLFGNWIVQYDEEVFVVFDPTTDGANILGAFRSLYEAENYLQRYMEVA